MPSRYINGTSVLAIWRGSGNSTPRRSFRVGCIQGAGGTAYDILGSRSSPDEFESGGDGHDSVRSLSRVMMCLCSST